jgi:hypothetical protein
MLDIQRFKDYERFRLVTEEGLSSDEADAVLEAGKKPFKPAFPRSSSVMMKQHEPKGPATTWAERVASYQQRFQQKA